MSYVNPLMALWQAGEPTLGAWLVTPDVTIAEMLASCGFDEVCADQQHGTLQVEDLAGLFQAIEARGSAPVTRVPGNDFALIGKSLDLGAAAVIIPMVNSTAEAARAVSAFHYPPRGLRSAGPVRAQYAMGGSPRELGAACVVMVETRDGLANVDEIAATPGVDAVYIGPGDLALALGMDWDPAHWSEQEAAAHADAVETVRMACERHGVVPGIHVGNAPASARYVEQGFRMITVSTDLGLVTGGGARELEIARAAVPPARRGTGPTGNAVGA